MADGGLVWWAAAEVAAAQGKDRRGALPWDEGDRRGRSRADGRWGLPGRDVEQRLRQSRQPFFVVCREVGGWGVGVIEAVTREGGGERWCV